MEDLRSQNRGFECDVCVVRCGVPQSFVLHPLLFIMFINDIVDSVSYRRCKVFMYADEIPVFFRIADL